MKSLLPSGFRELIPQKQAIEDKLKDIIIKNYKKNGFLNIEPPFVELNSVLTSKGGDEVSKQIFGLYGLAQGGEDLKDYSLHFDLTVPLARYVVEHENDIKFPFKRSQIGKVFRGERPQKCRYREFIQCDIDVLDTDLNINYDVEVIEILYKTIVDLFDFLEIKQDVEVHINSKHIINIISDKYSLDDEKKGEFFRLLDDYYKLPNDKYIESLERIFKENTDEIIQILSTKLEDLEKIFDIKNNTYINELLYIYNSLKMAGVNVIFDPYITRGLDYYTGVVFETFVGKGESKLSVCSGGRYDDLVSSIAKVADSKIQKLNGVGGSIGLSRLFCVLDNMGLINKKVSSVDLMIFNLGASIGYLKEIRKILEETDLSVDIYYNNSKLDKQFKYAENKNITYAIFAGIDDENKKEIVVKNLLTREQENISITMLSSYFK